MRVFVLVYHRDTFQDQIFTKCIISQLVIMLNGKTLNIIVMPMIHYMIFNSCNTWDDINNNILRLNKDQPEFVIFLAVLKVDPVI